MTTWIVSIEDYFEPGSAYYNVVVTEQAGVEALEAAAQRAGLVAVVRNADGFQQAMNWMQTNTPKKEKKA